MVRNILTFLEETKNILTLVINKSSKEIITKDCQDLWILLEKGTLVQFEKILGQKINKYESIIQEVSQNDSNGNKIPNQYDSFLDTIKEIKRKLNE